MRGVYYDENREDFDASKSTTLRLSYSDGKIIIDIDPRNTQRWYRCLTTARSNPVIAAIPEGWRTRATVGIVARTGTKRSNFEVLSLRTYNRATEALENARPEDGESDMALRIAHHLEHGMYNVKETIERMIEQLEAKAGRDFARIRDLEDKLEHSTLHAMQKRVTEMENRLMSIADPIMNARAHRVEYQAEAKLAAFKQRSAHGARGWLKPFIVVAVLLTLFVFYSNRELNRMKKWNKNYM